jgi:hypothetical protein
VSELDGARLFEAEIAPLFVTHCLECHDSLTRKSRLDLSRRATALEGGKSGLAIVPGKSGESRLWKSVESDEMPEDRQPLSAREKALLRQWIDGGATWPVEEIDPAAYSQDRSVAGNWVRRLTVPEYIGTVRSAVGVDIAKEAREILPPDVRADGFANTAYNLNIDLRHVESYARLAEIIVNRMDVSDFAARFSKDRKLTDDNVLKLVAGMGKWLLRGPLEEHEVNAFRGIATTVASTGGKFDEAARYILEAMLQSPRFIYRVENQRGDRPTEWGRSSRRRRTALPAARHPRRPRPARSRRRRWSRTRGCRSSRG